MQLLPLFVVQGVLYQENTSCNPPQRLGGGHWTAQALGGGAPAPDLTVEHHERTDTPLPRGPDSFVVDENSPLLLTNR